MTITVASFRRDLTEFADPVAYPASDVQLYLNLATKFLNQARWGGPSTGTSSADYSEWDWGAQFFIAHHLVLDYRDRAAADNGAPPGTDTGAVTSKSVDKVSVSYDVNATIDEGAGHWNLTVYGKRFIRLCRMMGAGPIQVGACPYADPMSSAGAFTGVWTGNGPNPNC